MYINIMFNFDAQHGQIMNVPVIVVEGLPP